VLANFCGTCRRFVAKRIVRKCCGEVLTHEIYSRRPSVMIHN
jgi:hypothetical protein